MSVTIGGVRIRVSDHAIARWGERHRGSLIRSLARAIPLPALGPWVRMRDGAIPYVDPQTITVFVVQPQGDDRAVLMTVLPPISRGERTLIRRVLGSDP